MTAACRLQFASLASHAVSAAAGVALLVPSMSHAATVDELAAIVQRQFEEIARLRERLDHVEADHTDQPLASGGQSAVLAAHDDGPIAETPVKIPQPIASIPTSANVSALPPGEEVTATRDGGLPTFRSSGGSFTFKPRGRVLTDFTSSFGSRYARRNLTTTGMRALRLGFEGSAGAHLFYALESDLAGNKVDVGTALVGWRGHTGKIDYDIRVGHLFNDRSFDGSTRSDATPFAERSVVGTAIQPQRGFFGTGGQVRLYGKDWHASLAVTGDATDQDQSHDDSITVMGRLHWNPFHTAHHTAHLAVWGYDESLASNIEDLSRQTVIGGRFNGNLRISTGPLLGARHDTGYGIEAGGYAGSLWIMSEVGQRRIVFGDGAQRAHAEAWSLSGGWFTTGETPPYSARTGIFAQPHVRHPVADGGWGALELTARYEGLNYTDFPQGGHGHAATLGANWYLNDFTRVMLNGIHWFTDNASGDFIGPDKGETVTMRVGVTF